MRSGVVWSSHDRRIRGGVNAVKWEPGVFTRRRAHLQPERCGFSLRLPFEQSFDQERRVVATSLRAAGRITARAFCELAVVVIDFR